MIETARLTVANLQHLNALFAQNPEATYVLVKGHTRSGKCIKTTATLIVEDQTTKAKGSKATTRALEEVKLFNDVEQAMIGMLSIIGLIVVAVVIGVGVDKVINIASKKVDVYNKENKHE